MSAEFQPVIPESFPPEISVNLDAETKITLRWDNTALYFFDVGDGMYDHVRYKLEDGSNLFLSVTAEEMEMLRDKRFTRVYHPEVDDATISWCANEWAKSLDS